MHPPHDPAAPRRRFADDPPRARHHDDPPPAPARHDEGPPRSRRAPSAPPEREVDPAIEAIARDLEAVLHEAKRVVVGQDAMLERVLIALLSGGHVLLEGVPGLAKTLTVKTLATVLGGSFSRVQFTPDLVPADLVGTRIWRPDTGRFEIQLGPVFGNLLLADEINRAPAKVQSALLEVMQERQVTLGGASHAMPDPFLVLATQNPIESEGTYPLPEAQVDRFLLKVLVDYPSPEDEARVVQQAIGLPEEPRQLLTPERLIAHRETVRATYADPGVVRLAVRLADATRNPSAYGLPHLEPLIEIGASPRGPIGLVQAAQALAVLRGRDYVAERDVLSLAHDVLRHRLLLSYEAHADGVTPDRVLDEVVEVVRTTSAPTLRSVDPSTAA
ncbi:MAG: AAA family ATPase [Solirubrobacteraceae bacterium]|nr:AAA family ATPase [Solirubrobacteraceae bacterium]